MNFQDIKSIEPAQFYLDLAFRRMREKGTELRQTRLQGGRIEKSRYIETLKMQVVADTLTSRMQSIVKSFPSLDTLPEFYNQLVRLHIEYGQLKLSLGSVHWLGIRAQKIFQEYRTKLKMNTRFERVNVLSREYLGRISSMVKQLKGDFIFLEQARKLMKGFPTIKTSLRTVSIVGFPNVGKTTILFKLTGSPAEISSYPFTTKGVNVAYIGKGKEAIQLLDTPGTLDRFEKMNAIEQIAYLAMKLCSQGIVYVFDPTEEYPLDKQEKLLEKLKRDVNLPLIVYISKTDVGEKERIDYLKKKYDTITDIDELKEKIVSLVKPFPEKEEDSEQEQTEEVE
ncbi:MAG: GTPase [Nanoarchaeota archaeon]|nr:GTPase [Nanoarchaeota archaeon]